jgi:hypothetical protein
MEELEIVYYPDADTVLENAVKEPIDIYFMDINSDRKEIFSCYVTLLKEQL